MNTKRFKLMIAVAVLMLLGGVGGTETSAQSVSYMNIPEMQRLSNEARQLWWNSLTPRERQLVRLVSAVERSYTQQTGNSYIPLTAPNLRVVLQRIEATEDEAEFVLVRMRVHARVGETIKSVDRSLKYMQENPYWYLPPRMRPQ